MRCTKMSKYVLTMTFTVSAESSSEAQRLGESIENIVSLQLEDKELFVALEDTYLDYVEELEEEI